MKDEHKTREELIEKLEELDVLKRMIESVNSVYRIGDVYRTALDHVIKLDYVDTACIYLVNDNGDEVVLQDYRNLPESYIRKASRISSPTGITWKVIKSGKVLHIEDIKSDPDVGDAARILNIKSALGIPISIEGKVAGVLWLSSYKYHDINSHVLEFLVSTGNQISAGIARARIYSTLSKKKKYQEIVNRITSSIHSSIDLQDVLENTVETLKNNLETVKHVGIYKVEGGFAQLKAYRGLTNEYIERAGKIPYPVGATWKTINDAETYYIKDVETDSVIGPAGRKLGTRSFLSMPIFHEEQAIGTVGIYSDAVDAFSSEELEILDIVTKQIEVAYKNAKQNEELKKSKEALDIKVAELSRRHRYEEILSRITRVVHSSIDINEVIENAVHNLHMHIDKVDHVGIYIVEDGVAVLKAYVGFDNEYLKNASRIPYPKGGTWKTILEGSPVHIHDVNNSEIIGPAGKALMESYLSTPINFDGDTIGCMGICSRTRNAFREEELNLLLMVSHQIEVAYKNATQAELIKKSEERYRSLVENSPDLIAETDTRWVLSFVNKSFSEFLGFEYHEIVGRQICEYIAEKDRDILRSEFEKVVSSEVSSKCELKMKSAGDHKMVECTLICSKNMRGERVVIVNSRDVTDRKCLEEEQIKSDKLESLGVLAGGIAHDFNNLITVISGNLSLLRLNMHKDERVVNKYLEDAENATLRTIDLTNQLLTFSKGGVPVKEIISSVDNLIKETAGFAVSGSNSKCEYNIDQDLYPVEVDMGQISQVIQNLVINADQSMPSGGIIEISARNFDPSLEDKSIMKDGSYIEIKVKDHGIGMSEDIKKKIFDPYFTTKQKGSGLGLSSVFSIIRNHQGYIFVESVLSKGTTFSVYLPATDTVQKTRKEQIAITEGSGKILVMDDDEYVRRVVGGMLENLGYEVDFAESGEEAIEKYRHSMNNGGGYIFVLMDLTVPGGMGGQEAQAHLLEIDPDVKTIVSSGYSNNPVLSLYRDYGFTGRVSKPYNIYELSRELHKIVNDVSSI